MTNWNQGKFWISENNEKIFEMKNDNDNIYTFFKHFKQKHIFLKYHVVYGVHTN